MSASGVPSEVFGHPSLIQEAIEIRIAATLVDKVANRLSIWKGRLMQRSSHPTLVKTTLMAIPIYTSISVDAQGFD
jgi:hypothetical protein